MAQGSSGIERARLSETIQGIQDRESVARVRGPTGTAAGLGLGMGRGLPARIQATKCDHSAGAEGGGSDGENRPPRIMRGPTHPSQAPAHPPPPSRPLLVSARQVRGAQLLCVLLKYSWGQEGLPWGTHPSIIWTLATPCWGSGLCDRQLPKLPKRGVSFKSNVLQATSGGTDWERLELAWGNSSSCHQMPKIYHVCWLPEKNIIAAMRGVW